MILIDKSLFIDEIWASRLVMECDDCHAQIDRTRPTREECSKAALFSGWVLHKGKQLCGMCRPHPLTPERK